MAFFFFYLLCISMVIREPKEKHGVSLSDSQMQLRQQREGRDGSLITQQRTPAVSPAVSNEQKDMHMLPFYNTR